MLILENVLNDSAIIKYLYHISDIHIRRYEKHNEFKYIFNKLYEYLEKVASDNGLIVITGDLLHNKDNLTPDCINITWDFLRTLSNIMPVILITGNHDFVETNNHIKDSIFAILNDKQKNENIYYLRESGAYRYGNVCFGVSSLIDKQHIYAKDIKTNAQYKIGLYHGGVGKTETSIGFKLNGDKLVSDFEGYDYTLLGDIHKYQYVSDNMAYASSLISQNFSEVDDYHGVLKWDLDNDNQEYVIIKNKYRYMEISVNSDGVYYNNEKIDYKSFEFPTNGRLRVNIIDEDYYINVKKYLRKKYKKISIYESGIIQTTFESEGGEKEDISYLSLLEGYIEKLDDNSKEKCREIFSANIIESDMIVEKSLMEWQLLDLEFSNLFSYGENNFIDFTKLQNNEITGLFAPNSYGKSTIIDILLLSLYEDFSRNVYSKHRTIPSYIINNKYKTFELKLRFTIGGYLYVIHKKGKLQKKKDTKTGKRILFEFNKLYRYEDDNEVDLTGKDRFETLQVLKEIIGSYDEFCLTTLFLQSNEKNFYDMKPQDRKNFLYNLLHLHKFEHMTRKFKGLSKENKILLKSIETNLLSNENIENYIDNNNNILEENILLENEIEELNNILNRLNNEKDKLLLMIDSKLLDSECKYDMDINELKERYNIIKQMNISNNIYKFTELKEYLLKRKSIYDEYKYKTSNLKKTLRENTINENCHICMKRKNKYDKLLEEYNYCLKQMELNKIDNYDCIIDKIIFLENIPIYNDNYLIGVLEDYRYSIGYKENIINIDKLNNINKELFEQSNKLTYLNNKLMENKINYNNNKNIIDNYDKNILLAKEYNDNIIIYDTLVKSVCIHGIPSVILRKYLTGIEMFMNNLIEKFIKRRVELILDGNYLYINIYDENNEIINILGGMEHFIVNISLKITLGRLSVLPKCGLLIIDEGVSVLDKEHIDKFQIIANFLKSNYKNVIIISHIDGIKDFITDFITINKDSNNDSSILF
jgi:DNA repair exonuclease SbcCD ATPase subunit